MYRQVSQCVENSRLEQLYLVLVFVADWVEREFDKGEGVLRGERYIVQRFELTTHPLSRPVLFARLACWEVRLKGLPYRRMTNCLEAIYHAEISLERIVLLLEATSRIVCIDVSSNAGIRGLPRT